jgi:hypothetical protein
MTLCRSKGVLLALTPRMFAAIFLFGAARLAAAGEATDYAAPDGTLALRVPAGWQVHRETAAPVTSTEIAAPGDGIGPRVYILCVTSQSRISPEELPEVAELLTRIGIVALRQDGKLISRSPAAPLKFHGRDALCTDVQARLGNIVYVSKMVVTLGRSHAYLLAVAAPANDPAGMKTAQAALATVALESDKPAAGAGLWTPRTLERVVSLARGGSIDPDTAVLVAGEPPLTAGAVRAWTRMVVEGADLRFTEAEAAALGDALVETYRSGGGPARERLARDGPRALADIRAVAAHGDAAATRELLDQYLHSAEATPWARTVRAALARRSEKRAEVRGPRPRVPAASSLNTALTRASLDASAEMIVFLWVAAGRKAGGLTPDDLANLRDSIEVQFPRMAADYQYLFANAERLYAGVRATWKSAAPDRRASLAKEFAASLDALGLPASSSDAAAKSPFDHFRPDNAKAAAVINSLLPLADK